MLITRACLKTEPIAVTGIYVPVKPILLNDGIYTVGEMLNSVLTAVVLCNNYIQPYFCTESDAVEKQYDSIPEGLKLADSLTACYMTFFPLLSNFLSARKSM